MENIYVFLVSINHMNPIASSEKFAKEPKPIFRLLILILFLSLSKVLYSNI